MNDIGWTIKQYKNYARWRRTGYRNCKICGKNYLFTSGQHNGESNIFCSKECKTKYRRDYIRKEMNAHPEYGRRRIKKRKLKILTHYSENPPKCACCGEIIIEFLCIDHINGGGNKHIKEITHNNFYGWLIRNEFPEGFQVLCYNCNKAKGRNKPQFCPVHHPELY
jgi:hypothetical protein